MKRKEGIDTLRFDITPEELAKDIFDRFFNINGIGYVQAKTSAIITIDLLIEELNPEIESSLFVTKIELYEKAKKHLFSL